MGLDAPLASSRAHVACRKNPFWETDAGLQSLLQLWGREQGNLVLNVDRHKKTEESLVEYYVSVSKINIPEVASGEPLTIYQEFITLHSMRSYE